MTEARIESLRKKLRENSISAYLITSYENYRYFSGFSGSNCSLVITPDRLFAFTDGRYDVQIHSQTKGFEITVISNPMHRHIAECLSSLAPLTVGYETRHITDFELRNIKELSDDRLSFVPCADFGEEIRAIKDESEIATLRRAAKCADVAFSSLCRKLSRGKTEREAAALLEYEMACQKSEAPSFSTIAASGLRGSMPHASPEDIEIPQDCLMTFDFGATYSGYHSDITRTVHIGKPKKDLLDLWELVYEVQQKCVAAVRPGVSCRELDATARRLFADAGMDKYFSHSLGHGVGLSVHEAPALSSRSNEILSENMLITIEPGLYIEGLGGVRIEDSVLVTKDGCEVLTLSPHRININF